MTYLMRLLGIVLTGLLVTACSGTKMGDSWSSPSYKGQIKKVYIIGIAENDLNRMIFENTFESSLTSEGVKAIASYKDLFTNKRAEREAIIRRMRANDCDSVLLTRVVSQQKKTISSGQGSYRYSPGVAAPGPHIVRPRYYQDWDGYYSYGSVNYVSASYVSASSVDIVTLTVESVLYDLKTEELIWSAQLETKLEGNLEKMMRIFVDKVTKDLRVKGLI